MRYRPIPEVIDEIRHHQGKYLFFTDDNIAINPDRARELFISLKPLGINWVGQFETSIINTPDIIRLAGESGCRRALVGVESLNQDNIISIQKKHNLNIPVNELIHCLKKNNIKMICSVMFGLDHDTRESIFETVKFMIDNKVETFLPWILTPFPKTPLHEQLKKENLILHDNYSLYDATHCVFKHRQIKPDELEEIYWQTYQQFYSLKPLLSRVFNNKKYLHFPRIFLTEYYLSRNVHRRQAPWASSIFIFSPTNQYGLLKPYFFCAHVKEQPIPEYF